MAWGLDSGHRVSAELGVGGGGGWGEAGRERGWEGRERER